MSCLSMFFNKYFIEDIKEASNGFFLAMCEMIDMEKSVNDILKLNVTERSYLCDRYGFDSDTNVAKIDANFTKYVKYTKYDLFNELRKYISMPSINKIIQIYGNHKIINADILLELTIDTNNYVADKFYNVLKPYTEISILDDNNNKSLIKKVSYYMQVSFSIDDLIKNFKIHNVVLNKPEIRCPKQGINFTANMVPIVKLKDIPLLTKLFIEKYDVTAPIDIEKVIYNIGLTVNDEYELIDTQGFICLTDGLVNVKDRTVYGKENTIFIDKNLKCKYGMGCYRFVLLHEAIHFEYHNYYLMLKRLANNIGSVKCIDKKWCLVSDTIGQIGDRYTDIARVEWQANNSASHILVPTEMLSDKLVEKINEYSYYLSENKERLLYKICKELAVYFKCSYQVMAIRINQVGIFDIKLKTNETTYISKDEALNVYNTNKVFKDLIDTRKVVYSHNRCVINNDKYIINNTITNYALNNPEESMLIFARNNKYFSNNLIYLARRKASSNCLLIK